MLVMNHNKYFIQILDIIKTWNRRYLNPVGKIKVVKTYILSKFVHLFTALPNPPSEFLKKLNTVIFQFIWDIMLDKIKHINIINPYNQGGLKMVNIDIFIKVLKITWVRRILKSESSVPWISLVNTMIPN